MGTQPPIDPPPNFATVCTAVHYMDVETLDADDKTIWDNPQTKTVELAPPVSPAVACTINLTLQYFTVYLLLAAFRSLQSFRPKSERLSNIVNVLQLAKFTVNMAPMLCVLFIGARMRALQIDPVHGAPQAWAQTCFYLCAYSVLVQTLMVVFIPLFGGATAKKGAIEGDVVFEGPVGGGLLALTAVRYTALVALYGGFTAVMASVIVIKAPQGMPTPDLSPAMSCVMNLTCQYFFVYLALFCTLTGSRGMVYWGWFVAYILRANFCRALERILGGGGK